MGFFSGITGALGKVGGAVSGVGKAVGGATDFLVGGKPLDSYNRVEKPMSDEEKARYAEIEKVVNEMLAQPDANQDLNALFKQHLLDFTSKDFGPNPTPEQLQQATSFIDQTFTAPAQQQLTQLQNDTEAQAQAKAAAMGRNGNLDASTQAAVAAEMARANLGVNAERGNRIGNLALQYNDTAYNRAGGQLNSLAQGSNFLNSLTQQAFNNKLNLLNARSGIGSVFQNERFQNRIDGGGGHSSGLLTNINSVQNSLGDVFSGGSTNRKFMQDLATGGKSDTTGGAGGIGSLSKLFGAG